MKYFRGKEHLIEENISDVELTESNSKEFNIQLLNKYEF
jgi:hypothetical protein